MNTQQNLPDIEDIFNTIWTRYETLRSDEKLTYSSIGKLYGLNINQVRYYFQEYVDNLQQDEISNLVKTPREDFVGSTLTKDMSITLDNYRTRLKYLDSELS